MKYVPPIASAISPQWSLSILFFSLKMAPCAGYSGAPVDLSDKLNFKTRFAVFKIT
jgi:hypothetical protein